jgi:hypothetical protein
MQLFCLYYRNIVDTRDLEWFEVMLEKCDLLDINNFLHDISLYVVNQLCPPYRAPTAGVPQQAPSSTALSVRFVESEIFESAPGAMPGRSSNTQEDLS